MGAQGERVWIFMTFCPTLYVNVSRCEACSRVTDSLGSNRYNPTSPPWPPPPPEKNRRDCRFLHRREGKGQYLMFTSKEDRLDEQGTCLSDTWVPWSTCQSCPLVTHLPAEITPGGDKPSLIKWGPGAWPGTRALGPSHRVSRLQSQQPNTPRHRLITGREWMSYARGESYNAVMDEGIMEDRECVHH